MNCNHQSGNLKSGGFFGNTTPFELAMEFNTPLYVYNEAVLRTRCREMKGLLRYSNFKVSYSAKANSNPALLAIIRQEGMEADAMSPGEIYLLTAAGFLPEEIFYISNNVSAVEMRFAVEREILVSVDSLSQLEQFGRINPGGRVAVRMNPGVGLGHHQKVVTGGKNTKFGISPELVGDLKKIITQYDLKLAGINQHLGSLFTDGEVFLHGVRLLLETAALFPDLEFIDLGGGFGIPYHKKEGQTRLDLVRLGESLDEIIKEWNRRYGKEIVFKIEPGRYLVAECGVLLGTVHALKENYGTVYAGTDLGCNVLLRPAMYDAYHELEVYTRRRFDDPAPKMVTVVGNICETGDILAKDRQLPPLKEGDLIGVLDAGAYGYSMSSNYNCRLRPAEVLIRENGDPVLIRRRDTLEDLTRNYLSSLELSPKVF